MKRIFSLLCIAAFLFPSCGKPPINGNMQQVSITYAVRMQVTEGKFLRDSSGKKMQSEVLELYNQFISNGNSFTIPDAVAQSDFMLQPSFAKIDTGNHVLLYISLRHQGPIVAGKPTKPASDSIRFADLKVFTALLETNKVKVVGPNDTVMIGPNDAHYIGDTVKFYPIVQAWVRADSLDIIARLPYVMHIALVTEPIVCNEQIKGSDRSRADIAQQIWQQPIKFEDEVKVGIISDDCGSKHEQSTNSIPLDAVPNPWLPLRSQIEIADDSWDGERSHEGIALMEVVHEVAPEAHLYFASGFGHLNPNMNDNLGMLNFMHSITTLSLRGCKVITDDILYIEEPAFEDGPIAQLINSYTIQSGNPLIYTSAAGNLAQDMFSFTFDPQENQEIGLIYSAMQTATIHNLSHRDYRDNFFIAPGATIDVMLQWDDPYMFPAAANDFDLYLVDVATNQIVQTSSDLQNGANIEHDCLPFEHFTYYASPCFGQMGYKLFVKRDSIGYDNPTPRMKLLIRGLNDRDQPSNAKSIFGHPTAKGCIACGAVNPYGDCDQIEPFSSLGPAEIVQTDIPAGNNQHRPLLGDTLIKPDLCTIDGMTTTVRPLTYFSGTSACAPLAAGIFARILGIQKPHITTELVLKYWNSGCIHYGDPSKIKNNTYGYGRLDAFKGCAMLAQRADGDRNLAFFQTDPFQADPLSSTASMQVAWKDMLKPFPTNDPKIFVGVTIEKYISIPPDFKLKLIGKIDGVERIAMLLSDFSPASSMHNMNVVFKPNDPPYPLVQPSMPPTMPDPFLGIYKPKSIIYSPPTGFNYATSGQTHWELSLEHGPANSLSLIKDWGIYIR